MSSHIIVVDRDHTPRLGGKPELRNWDANDFEQGGEDFPVGDTHWIVTPDPGDGNDEGEFVLQATRIGGPLDGVQFEVTLNDSFQDCGCTAVSASFVPV